jgi:hypothetical protein
MTMLSRLREKRTGSLATAIPAISATQPKGKAATVARIATVAVASPKEEKTHGDTPIPDDLDHLIRRAGTFWEYSPEDYALVRDLARSDPDGLRRALESDKWIAMAEHEAFEERAAIMEYEGGLSREEAKRLAANTEGMK